MKKWPKNDDDLLKRRKYASTKSKLEWLTDALEFTREIERARKKGYPKAP